jgi:drug/metabolite transporter (DMT)-like permease
MAARAYDPVPQATRAPSPSMSTVSPTATPSQGPAAGLSPLILACLAATWLVWGSTYLAIKFALVSFPPFFQMGTRFLAAGALLMAWMRWRGSPWPSTSQWWHALLVGTLMLGGGFGGTAYAELSVSSGLVVAFIAVVPLMIAALNLLWGVRPGRLEAVGIALGLVGVAMLTQGSGFSASPQGLVALLLACATWSVGSVLSMPPVTVAADAPRWQRGLPLAPGALGFASEMLCGGAVLMLMSLVAGERPVWPPESRALLAWVYLVVFGSLIAFNAYMVLLARAGNGLASSYTFVNPVIALLLGVALGGEVVSGFEWASAGVVLAGVVLLLIGRRG